MQVPDNVVSGIVTLDDAINKRLPDIPCRLVYLQAVSTNAGNITVGGDTVDYGQQGMELEPGEKLPTMMIDNLNRFYIYGVESDSINYLVIR